MKILSLTTYPTSVPLHGGQRRVNAIERCACSHGVEFRTVPFFFTDEYPQANDVEKKTGLDPDLKAQILAAGGATDADISNVIDPRGTQASYLVAQVESYRPDAVQFEHPWLYPLWKNLCELHREFELIPVFYSSHNIEHDLIADRLSAQVRALEMQISKNADLIMAVSAADARTLSNWTAPKAPVVVAPNGSWAPPPDPHLHRIIKEDYVLLAGSAHPPNARGLWETFGMVPGCIPPNGRLAIVGGMNNLLWDDPRHHKFRRLQDSVIYYAGVVSESGLNTLLDQSKGICLPITAGGGTNLKTAEALLRLKPVVAMRKAFRGFEAFSQLSGVYIADTRTEFQKLIRMLFADQLECNRTFEDVRDLTWEACLSPFFAALEPLAKTKALAYGC